MEQNSNKLYTVLPADKKAVADVGSKIQQHYKTEFSSSPIEVDDKEVEFIIDNDCKCYSCDKSIFEMNDFPELLIEDEEILCEDCYDEQHRKICPICENSYDVKDGESEYSIMNESDANEGNEIAGIYHNGNLIVPININYLKKIDCGENCCEVWSDDICEGCVADLVRKDNFIKSHGTGTPCILIKKYDNDDLFKDYTPEKKKMIRQKMINKRITIRGMIQTANKSLAVILVGFFICW
jgi:hypothetical protein